ncbi:MAG TPA: DEAD/DEAH box helicase [Solirubrobacteraceae bacterium]|nr:DEAD/DEAH box helicase [Solirubrobacteraceae bacterium]
MSPTFAELGVSEAVAGALAKRGIETPFVVQSMVMPDVLEGHDVLVKSPTGSGKTLAFGAPIADMVDPQRAWPSALVLAPTRELAAQIVDELAGVMHARGLKITAVYGGVGIHNQAKQARRSHVLVATPGRLLDLIERGAVRLDDVELLVLDEADRMLDMGFKPAVDRIVRMTPADRQTLLFSATLEGEVGRIAAAYTRDARRHDHAPAPERVGHIEHRFHRVAHEAKVSALVHELGDPKRGLTLVFVRTKRGADRLVKRLGRHDVQAVAMHGDKSQPQREKALARFESGLVKTLVATDVAARGIDVSGITHVINFDAPAAREDYVHRIGRTARAGASGVGITFVLDDQAREVAKLASELGLEHGLGVQVRSPAPRPAGRSQSYRPRGGRARRR